MPRKNHEKKSILELATELGTEIEKNKVPDPEPKQIVLEKVGKKERREMEKIAIAERDAKNAAEIGEIVKKTK